MPSAIVATSPAPIGDATSKRGDDGVKGDAAAAALMQAFAAQEKSNAAAPSMATDNTTPEVSSDTPNPVVEAPNASPEVASEETPTTEETPAKDESEATADETALSHSTSELTPEVQEILNRRIGREIAKTKGVREQFETKIKDAEAKVAALEARLNTTPAEPQVASAPDDSLSHINDPVALNKLKEDAMNAIDFVEERLEDPRAWQTKTEENGTETKFTVIGNQAYTEADLKASRRVAKATLERKVPQRAAFLQAKAHADQQAFQKFPWMIDKTSPEYQQAQAAFRTNPWLSKLPNASEIVGVQIEGLKAIAARETAAKAVKTAAAIQAKPKVISAKPSNDQAAVSSSGAGTRAPGQQQRTELAGLQAKLNAKGGIDRDDAKALMIASDKARSR